MTGGGATSAVLYAEDDENDTFLMQRAFRQAEITNPLRVVEDGRSAMQYLAGEGPYADRQEHPAACLLLLDLKMPKVDGLEVLRQVKGDPNLRIMPVVMMTSSREEQDLVKSYELGVNSYLVKPVKFQRFVESVRQLGVYWALMNEPPPGTGPAAS